MESKSIQTFSYTLHSTKLLPPKLVEVLLNKLNHLDRKKNLNPITSKLLKEAIHSIKDHRNSLKNKDWYDIVFKRHMAKKGYVGFPRKLWSQYILLWLFRRSIRSNDDILILGKTYDSLSLLSKVFGEKTVYSLAYRGGDWDVNRIVRKVELLIKQAGMIPFRDIRNEVEPFGKVLVDSTLYQHHYWYDKRSCDSIDLILLGLLHNDLTVLEPLKPPEYSAIISEFRIDFENALPWRGWSLRLKGLYNERIRQIIEQWRNTGEIQLLGITSVWLKDYGDDKIFTLNLLNGRIVGKVNYLTRYEQNNIITREFTMHQFINYIIENIAQKLGI